MTRITTREGVHVLFATPWQHKRGKINRKKENLEDREEIALTGMTYLDLEWLMDMHQGHSVLASVG